MIGFVPLLLFDHNENILWKNSNPNSTENFFPLEIIFEKENGLSTNNIFKKYMSFFSEKNNFDFKLIVLPTMMGQKSINACCILKDGAKGVDTHLCYLCSLRSSCQNSFQNLSKEYSANDQFLIFAISPLHAFLNVTKFIIYNISPTINNFSKQEINSRLESAFNIHFNEIRRGFGTKITGNVARLFFENTHLFSKTIVLPTHFIENFKKILYFIRSKERIDMQHYEIVCKDIIKYLSMNKIHITPTIHKILFHGHQIISFIQNLGASEPGVFSEEAIEASIRKIRKIRKENSRLISRKCNNKDTLINSYIYNKFDF